MASIQRTGFVHSTPIPSLYKTASKIARKVKEGEDSLKNLIYRCRNYEVKKVYALVLELFKRNDIIDDLLQRSQILVKEPRFDIWLAKILIWEILWGKQTLKRGCKPIEIILNHEKILRELLKDCKDSIQPVLKHDILKPRYVRVNTLKITTEEAVSNFIDEGWSLVPFSNKSNYKAFQDCLNNLKPDEFIKDIHVPNLLIFPPKTQFHHHEAYKSGCIILQDKASCLPVHLLDPSPGSVVLDTCAAPGMKTTQLAALLQNEGTVYAVEVSSKRSEILRQIVESAGATCVKTILKDVMEVTDKICPDIEYILVDPSCSGSGITDRIEIEKSDLDTRMQRLKKLCNFQAKLLRHTMKSFPKARRIVYSTCSLNSEENEDVVRQILETSREFKLIDAKEKLVSWNTKTSEIYTELGNMCIFATPEEDKTNGFFVAVFERLRDGEKNPYLNYELCKLYDKQLRRDNTYDGNQLHTKPRNDGNSEKLLKECESTVDGNKNLGKSSIKKIKDENMCTKSYEKSEDIEQIESCQPHKKNKKSKLQKEENEYMDSGLENTMHYMCSSKGKKDMKSSVEISIEFDLTSKEKKSVDKKSKRLKKENKHTDLSPENSLVSENTCEKSKKKRKRNDLDIKENEITDLYSENPAQDDHKEKERKKKNKKHNLDQQNITTDPLSQNSIIIKNKSEEEMKENKNLYREKIDIGLVAEENVQLKNRLIEGKRKKNKNKTLDKDESDLFNHKLEKKKLSFFREKEDTNSISENSINDALNHEKYNDTEINTVSDLKKTIKKKKKKNKCDVLDKPENENTAVNSENPAAFHELKEEKGKKRNKMKILQNDKEFTNPLLENSIVIENPPVKEKKKKNKSKKIYDYPNSDIKENENTISYNEEMHLVLDNEEKSETRKRKRTACKEEHFKQLKCHVVETEKPVKSKEKKVKNK